MGLTAKSTGKDFKQVPPGNHVAICYAVIDLGTQHKDAISGEWGSQPARDVEEILFMWELPHEMVTYEDKEGNKITRPQAISFFYTNSLNEKANLRKHLESWRTRAFTQEELRGFKVSAVLGKPCMLNVVHKTNGKAQITSVGAMPKGMDVPERTNDLISFDLDNFDQEVFDRISKGIQDIIKRSAEWQQFEEIPVTSTIPEVMSPSEYNIDSDDIPF